MSFLSILSRGFPHLNTHTNTLYTHIYIYRSNDTYKDGRIENDRDGCHRGVRLDRVFSFSREWKGQQKLDGAAFLETFDDGLKGWVKSEVEQYTGA